MPCGTFVGIERPQARWLTPEGALRWGREYLWFEKTSTGTSTKHIYVGDMLVATIEDSSPAPKIYYNHLDHLGSSRVVTDDVGYITQELDYYPFGDIRVENQYTELDQTKRYTNYDYDSETNLSYAGARYQSGAEGRFVSIDPASLRNPAQFIRDPQQLNSYSYTRNNPIVFYDPSGENAAGIPAMSPLEFGLVLLFTPIQGSYDPVYEAEEYAAQSDMFTEVTGVVMGSLGAKGKVGGSYTDIKGVIKGNEAHHMPADSVSPFSRGEGPAISMEKSDHYQTASWGRSQESIEYRSQQSEFIQQGNFREAFMMDVNDVQSKFGSKYNAAIQKAKVQLEKLIKKYESIKKSDD